MERLDRKILSYLKNRTILARPTFKLFLKLDFAFSSIRTL